MAKKATIDLIIKTFRELGGNVSDVLGSRTNVSFLGVGDNVEPFLDKNLNTEALGVLSQSKAIDEAKNAVGFAVGDKLNDIQANNLLTNLNKMKEFYMPAPVTNITDMATGTRNLDAEGLGALRAKGDYMTDEGVMASETILPMRKTDNELAAMAERLGLNDPNKNRFLRTDDLPEGVGMQRVPAAEYDLRSNFPKAYDQDIKDAVRLGITDLDDLPPPGSRGGPGS